MSEVKAIKISERQYIYVEVDDSVDYQDISSLQSSQGWRDQHERGCSQSAKGFLPSSVTYSKISHISIL